MKIFDWFRRLTSCPCASREVSRNELTRSAITQLPVIGPPLGEQIRRERQKAKDATPNTESADGKTCPACGCHTAIKILNYWYDQATDIVTPADTVQRCIGCGWAGPVIEQERRW